MKYNKNRNVDFIKRCFKMIYTEWDLMLKYKELAIVNLSKRTIDYYYIDNNKKIKRLIRLIIDSEIYLDEILEYYDICNRYSDNEIILHRIQCGDIIC